MRTSAAATHLRWCSPPVIADEKGFALSAWKNRYFLALVMDPFYLITQRTKSRSAFSKKSVSSERNSRKDQIEKSEECSNKPMFDSFHCVARRTRSRAAVVGETVSFGKNSREGSGMPLEGRSSSSKRKKRTGDGRKYWDSQELGHRGGKGCRDNDDAKRVVLDSEDDEEECRGGSGSRDGKTTSDSDSSENFDLGNKADSGLHGVEGDKCEEEEETEEDVAVKKSVLIDLCETQSSTDDSDKNDDSEDEDLGMEKSQREPSSSSSGDENKENANDANIASDKNDDSCEISPDSSDTNDDDSEDEDLGLEKSQREPSSSSSGDEDKENANDANIASSKNDDYCESSIDSSDTNDDDSEDEDFVMDESHIEPSSSSSGDEDEENEIDCHIVRKRKRNVVGDENPNIDSVPISSDEPQSSTDGSVYIHDSSDENPENYGKNDSHMEKSTSCSKDVGEEKHRSVVSQIKRKRCCGLDTSCSVHWENCVAQRMPQSQTGSSSENKQKKGKKKPETPSQRICFSVEDDDSSTGNDEDEDGVSGSDRSNRDYGSD